MSAMPFIFRVPSAHSLFCRLTPLLGLMLASAGAQAADFRVTTHGTITGLTEGAGFWDSSVVTGASFRAEYDYTEGTGDENGSPASGEFRSYGGVSRASLWFGNYHFTYGNSFVQIVNGSGFDQYNFAPSSSQVGNIQEGLFDASFTNQITFAPSRLATDQLPLFEFSSGQFTSSLLYFEGYLDVDDEDNVTLLGVVTSYTVTPIPEPAAAAVLTASLAFLIPGRRRRFQAAP